MSNPLSTLKNDKQQYERGCWFPGCKNEPTHAKRTLHQVGLREYDDVVKTVWAPCSKWRYGCDSHKVADPPMFAIGELCPHGSTGKERGIPVPNLPLVGKTAIVLETDI